MKKKFKNSCLFIGALLVLIGTSLLLKAIIPIGKVTNYEDNKLGAGYKLIHGELSYQDKATDEEFNIEAPSSILIRSVEMVQYYRDYKGVRLVLANHQVDSFTVDGVSYDNPDFSKAPKPMVFFTDTFIGEDEILLDDALINYIVYSDDFPKQILNDLTIDDNDYGLLDNDNNLVSGDDDWALGDIKVTYYYVDLAAVDEIYAVGQIKDNTLNPNSDNVIFKTEAISLKQAKIALIGNIGSKIVLLVLGAVLILISSLIRNEEEEIDSNYYNYQKKVQKPSK